MFGTLILENESTAMAILVLSGISGGIRAKAANPLCAYLGQKFEYYAGYPGYSSPRM
jgi:hypothetical protein